MGKFKEAATRRTEAGRYRKLNQVDKPMCDCIGCLSVAEWMDRHTGKWLCDHHKNSP